MGEIVPQKGMRGGKQEHFPVCYLKAWSKESIIEHSENCKSQKLWGDPRGRGEEGPEDEGPC